MEQRRLGGTAAVTGVLGMGTRHWPAAIGVDDARSLVADLVDCGGDVLDVAATSAAVQHLGPILDDPGLRRGLFLSVSSSASPTRRTLLDDLDACLHALGQDHVDLWTVVAGTGTLPWEELVSTLAVAVATGRARYVGLSPTRPWQGALVGSALAMHPQRSPLATLTSRTSLLDRSEDAEMTAIAQSLEAGILGVAPLAGGVLTGKYRHATPADSRGASERDGAELQGYRGAWARPVLDGLVAAAEGLGVSPATTALAWARDRPLVSCLLVGARTVHQWRGAVASLDLDLPTEIRLALDDVSARAAPSARDGRL